MVFVGSGSVSFDTDPDSGSSPTFDTDPDPGKLYRSGSATLLVGMLKEGFYWQSITH